jgi:hypothetical protein
VPTAIKLVLVAVIRLAGALLHCTFGQWDDALSVITTGECTMGERPGEVSEVYRMTRPQRQ